MLFLTAIAVIWLFRGLKRSFTQPGNVREATPYAKAHYNVKQLGIAMWSYQEHHGHFPPAARFTSDGKPLLSWRVLVLPYLGEQGLYEKFKLDEPWDSPTNLPLLNEMPRVFKSPKAGSPPTETPYQVFVGKGAAFEGTSGMKVEDFTDGTDQTILIVEASQSVPWTKPQDVWLDPGDSLPGFGNITRHSFLTALADGSVRGFPNSVPEKTLRAFITRNAGDDPGKDW